MKNLKITLVILTLLTASAFTLVHSINWNVDDATYSVKFSGKKVNGIFKGLKANIIFDDEHPEKSKIAAFIDASTINCGSGMLNKYARTPEALDIDNYSSINYQSSAVKKTATGYEATGELTMKGMTKTIVVPFTFDKTPEGGIFKGKFNLNPNDYHIFRKGVKGKKEIMDRIDIDLNIPVKQ